MLIGTGKVDKGMLPLSHLSITDWIVLVCYKLAVLMLFIVVEECLNSPNAKQHEDNID